MALRLPRLRRTSNREVAAVPPGPWTAVVRLVAQLEDNVAAYVDGLAQVLSGELEASTQVRGARVSAQVTGAALPWAQALEVPLDVGFPGTPAAVWLLDASADGLPHLSGLAVQWSLAQTSQGHLVRVEGVDGLQAGALYTLTFLVLPA